MNSTSYEYVIYMRDKMSDTMKRVGVISDSTYQRMIKKQNELNTSTSNFGETVKRVFLTYFGMQAVRNIANVTAEVQSLTNSISFISGSSKEADSNLAFLGDMSNKLGLDLMATYEGFKTLTGGFKGSKVTMEDQKKMFYQVSTAVTAMGLSAEKAKSVNIALGQMASKGVVSMEELRQQLGEHLPGAFAIAAKSMGMTTQAFNKAVAMGTIMSEDFLPKFARQMEIEFSGGLDKATHSLRANLNRWNNAFLNIKLVVGDMLIPVIENLTGYVARLSAFIKEHSTQIRAWVKWTLIIGGSLWAVNKAMKAYNAIKAIMTYWTLAFNVASKSSLRQLVLLRQGLFWSSVSGNAYAGSMSFATVATSAFRIASIKLLTVIRGISVAIMSIPVIGWILAAVSGLILLFRSLWNHSEKFRGIMYGIAEVAKFIFGGILNNVIMPFINGMVNAFRTVASVFGKIYSFIKVNIVDRLKLIFGGLFDFLRPLIEGFANLISFIFKPVIDLWNKIFPKAKILYSQGYAKGVNNFRADKGLVGSSIPGLGNSSMGGKADPLGDIMTKGSDNITGGGTHPTNITINLGKLVEKIEVHSTTLREGIAEIQSQVEEAMLRVLNSSAKLSVQ